MNILDKVNKFTAELIPLLKDQEEKIKKLKYEVDNQSVSTKKIKNDLEDTINENNLLQIKLKKINDEYEKKMSKINIELEPLKDENDKLKRRMQGLENTIKVISEWVPSQKESIEVLVALASSPDEFISFDDIGEMSKIASVVLKNRILPMLLDKGFIIIENDQVKMKSIE